MATFMNHDFSISDSNIIRAKEGIRVLEDICRFQLREKIYFARLKTLRHELDSIENKLKPAHLLYSRINQDIGKEEVVKEEYQRQSVWSLIRANCRRIAESLRVLEEMSKVYSGDLARELEDYRYQIYDLELKMLMQTPHFWLNKYFEEGVIYTITDSVEEAIWLIEHGAKIIQLRDKKSSRRVVYQKVKYLCDYLQVREQKNKTNKVLLIVNDDIEIASLLPVAGVHLGQDDGNLVEAREKLGSAKIVGHSNHSLEQVKQSVSEGWDYVAIGPVYPTSTKSDYEALGLEVVRQVADSIHIPWLVIGGINKENINEVKKFGAKNFAVVRSAREFFNK